MITVEEAFRYIDHSVIPFSSEMVPLIETHGRVLDEDIIADRDFPPYHRSAMDGIAISGKHLDGRLFEIVGEQVAGAPRQTLEDVQTCYEIMTGASVPIGAAAVVRYEDVTIVDGMATVNASSIKLNQNIHLQGSDAKVGDVLIEKGKRINAGDIGILSSVGKVKIRVKNLPKVALVSTGDELVEPHEQPLEYQVRKSNIYSLLVELRKEGITVAKFHFDDSYDELKMGLTKIMEDYDVLLMSGGVSKGKRDFIPEVLEAIGVKKHFHRIAQKPGKPMWFGSNEQIIVFGFPGNPVSTLACYAIYFQRWLTKSLGLELPRIQAELTEDVHFKPDLVYHIPVTISYDDNRILATPFLGNGSGDLVNLSRADAFLSLPLQKQDFQKGECFPVVLI